MYFFVVDLLFWCTKLLCLCPVLFDEKTQANLKLLVEKNLILFFIFFFLAVKERQPLFFYFTLRVSVLIFNQHIILMICGIFT
jgi:hypothetical protein